MASPPSSTTRCEIAFPAHPATQDEALRRERIVHRFSAPLAIHRADTLAQVLPTLTAVADAQARGNWCIGFVAYEAAAAFDGAFKTHPASTPLAWFAEFAAPDEGNADDVSATFEVGSWQSDTPDAAFDACIAEIRAAIHEGGYYQVNFTTRLGAGFSGDALSFFRRLQIAQPRGYQCFIETHEFALLSVSPELFFSVRDGLITTEPMKGTTARGDSKEEDDARANYLLTSAKERAENLMIVDLLRNDLSRIARPGSVSVPQLFNLYAYPSVWQMTSTVQAQLRPDAGLPQIFSALFPCGSVTGAPKIAAMQAIAALEHSPRGIYCGAIGYAAPYGPACFNVGIRSVWLAAGRATCGVGSGITYDSTSSGEAEEVWFKSRFVRRASKAFALFETIRLQDGVYALIDLHLARIAHSAKHFGFRFDVAAAERALTAVQRKHPHGIWRVKLTSDREGIATADAVPLDQRHLSAAPLLVAVAPSAVDSRDEFLRHKTTRREVYDQHVPTSTALFDTLLYNEQDQLTEFTRANLVVEFFDAPGLRFTPPLHCGLLNGTLRQSLLSEVGEGRLRERVIRRAELRSVAKMWWINSLRGWVDVQLSSGTTTGK